MSPLANRISANSRAKRLSTAADETFDLLIVGGGITGAGVALEASRRGLRVLLVEGEDYAAGTSSRSSKLIHGGLRYLAKGDVDLVRKTARERKAVHRIAPHLAASRRMVLPAQSRARWFTLRAAISTYERLGQVSREDRHENWKKRDLAKVEPLINTDRFPFAIAYREYLTDDARLVLANLRAAAGHGAVILNRTRVVGLLRERDRVTGAVVLDTQSGERLGVRAKLVVNAAGPWVEDLLRMESPRREPMLTLTKGIHVVLPRERMPVSHTWVVGAPDNRPIFVVPRGEVVYVGTTDTVYGDPATVWPGITRPEVEYLLASLPTQFRVEGLKPSHAVSAWGGLRALVAQPGKRPSEISRNEEIITSPGGVITVAGGKLTGYRAVAKKVLQLCADRIAVNETAADEAPLPGGDFGGNVGELARAVASRRGLDAQSADRIAHLYGAESDQVLALGQQRLHPASPLLDGEVHWAMRYEDAQTLEDLVYRRSRIALYTTNGLLAIDAAAQIMGEALGWDERRRAHECAHVRARFAKDLELGDGPSLLDKEAYDETFA